ncbi:MAG: zinc-binding dehydrogenase [Novosphingobium sp.]
MSSSVRDKTGFLAALAAGHGLSARLAVAKDWGADHLLDLADMADTADRIDWVRGRTAGRGADIVMNCANAHAFLEGMRMVRPGGRLIQVGISGANDIPVPPKLLFRGVQIISTVMAEARHFHQAVDFIATRQDSFDFNKLISNRYPLDQLSQALMAMAELREVKPVIVPHLLDRLRS